MAAANSIFKLKVETSEYDQKLANAAKGIRHLADVAHKADGDLTGLEKSELDYIRALGEMETKSRSASGQLRELSSTYKELKVVYDQLNEVEKADEGGKALAASLETLKQRAQEAKAQLDSASQSLNDNGEAGKGTSSVMEMLKEKFTVNIDAIKLFNIGLQATEGALSVAKDAFFASEATVDEWGRVVDSSKSLYEGFLTALNTGDISGYLGRIDEIVTAARRAYDELDRLGTMKTIQAPKMSAQQTENERMRMMIQTGRYIAPVDGRRASMKDGQLLTPDQIRRIEAQLQNGMKTVVSLVGNEVKQTGKAIDAVYNRQAQELGMSLKEFRKGTSSMAEFDKRMAGYDQYQKWREQHTTIDMQSGREIVARGNPFEQFAKWGTFRVDGERYNNLVGLIQQRDQQAGQAYGMQSQVYRTMNRAEGVTLRQIMGGGGGGGSTGSREGSQQTELQQNQARINTLTQEYVRLGDEATEAARQRQEEIQKEIALLEKRNGLLGIRAEQAKGKFLGNEGLNVQDEFQKIKRGGIGSSFGTLPTMEETLRQRGGNLLDDKAMKAVNDGIYGDTGKKGEKNSAKSLLNGISQLTDGLQKIGIDIPEEVQAVIGVVQGMMQVIEAVNTIIGVTQTTALTANTAAMISLEAALWANTASSVIPFANGGVVHAAGGIVTGSTYSGDQIPAMLNAGEVVLNRAQAGNLASQLGGNGGQMQLETTITGEQIRLVLNNNSRRRGKGEYVTSKKRKS